MLLPNFSILHNLCKQRQIFLQLGSITVPSTIIEIILFLQLVVGHIFKGLKLPTSVNDRVISQGVFFRFGSFAKIKLSGNSEFTVLAAIL